MTFGSLFTGVGGMDLGLERAGWTCRWQVEIDRYRRRVLARHWPHVPKRRDIRELDEMPAVDAIAGGFPCKQTSEAAAIHGRREGLDGDDSGLWWEQLRVIREARPRWAVVENVAGVAAWSAQIAAGLEGLGYRVSRLALSAGGVGAPHLRRRVFLVAHPHGARLPQPRQPGPRPPGVGEGLGPERNPWLQALPGVPRMADGVPARMDRRPRIRALGDAVCPAVAEQLGRLILAADAALEQGA